MIRVNRPGMQAQRLEAARDASVAAESAHRDATHHGQHGARGKSNAAGTRPSPRGRPPGKGRSAARSKRRSRPGGVTDDDFDGDELDDAEGAGASTPVEARGDQQGGGQGGGQGGQDGQDGQHARPHDAPLAGRAGVGGARLGAAAGNAYADRRFRAGLQELFATCPPDAADRLRGLWLDWLEAVPPARQAHPGGLALVRQQLTADRGVSTSATVDVEPATPGRLARRQCFNLLLPLLVLSMQRLRSRAKDRVAKAKLQAMRKSR